MKKLFYLWLLTFGFIHSYAQDTTYHQRLYLGTGEYSPSQDWHAVIRFDKSEGLNSEPGAITYTPDGTIPVQQCLDGSVILNFGHGIYIDESNDRMYLSTLFTNQNNVVTTNSDTAVGSIAIFDNISTLDGPQVPTRHIFGSNTQLKQPHSCWLDESRDILYVPNTFGKNILVFENVSAADGDIVPDRIIDSDSLGYPLYIYIDETVDRMFVCAMPGPPTDNEPNSQVLIYNNASTLNGNNVVPAIRITGANTRLDLINKTVHNCQWNPNNQLLAVGHHTNELLFFDLNGINWSPAGTDILDLTPRVLRVDDPALGFDSTDVNLYGIFWDINSDTIYCSVGIDNPGGGPMSGSPPNSIKIYGNVSNSAVSGLVQPSRIIYWSNGNTYYPPQPIWVQQYYTVTNDIQENYVENGVRIYPNPASGEFVIEFTDENYEHAIISITNLIGQTIYSAELRKIKPGHKETVSIPANATGILCLMISSGHTQLVKKIIVN